MNNCSLIKSCERVRDLGEVFTPPKIVCDMCNLIPNSTWKNIDSTFLEPACGNGNFLVEILSRKLRRCKNIDECLRATKSIYGVDIMQDNISECKCRLLTIILKHVSNKNYLCITWEQLNEFMHVLETNIICGNTLTMLDCDGNDLKFKDWKTGEFETLKHMLHAEPEQITLDL